MKRATVAPLVMVSLWLFDVVYTENDARTQLNRKIIKKATADVKWKGGKEDIDNSVNHRGSAKLQVCLSI